MDLDKVGGAIESAAERLALPASFVLAVCQKDLAYADSSGYWSTLNAGQQIQFVMNCVLGHTTGYNPWPSINRANQSFNFSGGFNGIAGLGALLWGFGKVGILDKKIERVGGDIFAGGFIGGMFDPEPSSALGASNYVAASQRPAATGNPFQSPYAVGMS
jgi:hypothetical protein